MSAYLLDTNAIVFYYRGDPRGREVEHLLRTEPLHRIYVTSLTVLEMRSALARLSRQGTLTADQCRIVLKRFDYDVSSLGRFHIQPIRRTFVDPCSRMIEDYAIERGFALTTLDCIHLLTASDLKTREMDLRLVTGDQAFARVAATAGLSVLFLEGEQKADSL